MELRYIPAGEFMMGSPESEKNRDNDEGPVHRINISKGFYIGIYQVTQEQYMAVMGKNPSHFSGTNLPVEQVTWDNAVEFCKKLSWKEGKIYRLPTEAEWEYACRAGTNTRFYYGDDDSQLADYGWYESNSGDQTHPVGQKKPNAFGLYDMHGNVWEWSGDCYDENYYKKCPTADPQGPNGGQHRVLRGGSWFLYLEFCRSASRSGFMPGDLHSDIGFRVVIDIDAEKESDLQAEIQSVQKTYQPTDESLQPKIESKIEPKIEPKFDAKIQPKIDVKIDAKTDLKITAPNIQFAETEKLSKFDEFLIYAKARDNKITGQDALRALEQALAINPDNSEALALKKKIAEYYIPKLGDVIANSIGVKLAYIPAGEFLMGSPESEADRDYDESPLHRVKISKSFYIGIYQVTQDQYASIMEKTPSTFNGYNLPVEQVSWYDVTEFCKKLSRKEGKIYRLPTEAEWEYTCRAGTSTPFYFGETINKDLANYGGNYRERTTQVGIFPPNAFGLYDMHGNVWEWCHDWHSADYYSRSPAVDPQGPPKGQYRILRGGFWGDFPRGCRSALRFKLAPGTRNSHGGFRLVGIDL